MARILPAASDGGGHELIVRSFAGILILASGVTSSKYDGDSSSTSELDDHCEDRTTIIGERRRRHRFSSFPPHPGSFNLGRKRDLYIGISFSDKLNVINNLDSGCSNDLLLTVAIELAAYDS